MPRRVHTVVVSVQHSEKIGLKELRAEVMTKVIQTVIPADYLDEKTIVHINPCGNFILGGPQVGESFQRVFSSEFAMSASTTTHGRWKSSGI